MSKPMSKPIDWSKEIRTVFQQRPCRVLATDFHGGKYTVVVAIRHHDGAESIVTATPDGRQCVSDDAPFFENIPERFSYVRWVNVYPDGPSDVLHDSYDSAKRCMSAGRIRIVRVLIEGEAE